MAHLSAALVAVRARIITVWPETATKGAYHVMQLARLSLDSLVTADDLPCAAFELGVSSPTPFADMTSGADDALLTISYVATDSVTVEAMLAKLEALRDSFWATRDLGAAGAQVAAYPQVSYSTDLYLNRYFTNTQRPFIAGAVLVRLVTGELP